MGLLPGRGDIRISRISEIAPILSHVVRQLTLVPARTGKSEADLVNVMEIRHATLSVLWNAL